MNIRRWRQFDFSLGVQEATTWLMKKPNELARGINLKFTETVGAYQRRNGFLAVGEAFATDLPPSGGHVARFTTGSVPFVAVNNSGGTATIIRTQDTTTNVWTTLAGISYPVNSVIFFTDHLDEVYISGFDPATGDPVQPYNVDKTLDVSSTRNILNMPAPYFIQEFLGLLYAGNVKIGATRYQDRVYKSSPPLGAVTFIQGAQTDLTAPVTLVDNVPTMTDYTTPFGVASASSEVNTSNRAWQAFDDTDPVTSTSRWISATTTGTLKYDFGSGNAKTITYYSIVGENTGETPNRGPKTWTFEGSNDNTTWDVLHSVVNAPTWNRANAEKRIYNISNTTAYRYYRLNITANQGADYVSIHEFELMTSTEGTKSLLLKLDSVRYLKPGMQIDMYKAGTEQKLYDITILDVDKPNNTVTFDPLILPFATGAVDVTNNIITVSSTTAFPTGTPIKFDSSNTVPAPLVANTIYYAINVSSTTIKVATSLANARVGNGIDLTSAGSGNHRLKLSYVFNDNDEVWLDGRKGKLTMLWNTDYPNPEASEFLAVKPGTDSSNVISSLAKSSNRLFIFTKNSGTRWDGQNLIVFNNSIGCISHRSVANIDDDWLIWVDQKGNVRARNETAGQQENISRGIRNRYLRKLTLAQLKATSGFTFDNSYRLFLGTIGGENIRVVYDFDANTWSPERLARKPLIQTSSDASGILQPYFFADNGKYYQDDIGNTDDGATIPMESGTGRDMFGTEQKKQFYGITIFSQNANGLKIQASVDGGQMKTIGRIDRAVCFIKFPENGESQLDKGTSFDWQLTGSLNGDPPIIEGAVVYYIVEEDIPSERRG